MAGCERLREELRYLHRSMFHRPAPEQLIDAYVRAHSQIEDLSTIDQQQLRAVQIIVARRLDAVGIEPWLRTGRYRHALSAKLLLLAYLAEVDASHPEYVRTVSGGLSGPPGAGVLVRAISSMCSATLLAALRLMRGYLQKARNGIV